MVSHRSLSTAFQCSTWASTAARASAPGRSVMARRLRPPRRGRRRRAHRDPEREGCPDGTAVHRRLWTLLWTLLWRNSCGYGAHVATHDPTRDVQRFDAYRAALRDAVGDE